MTHKRLTLFAGHYGSGKTNIALNYARWLRRKGEAVTVADLDIVNPYFRTKDSEEDLKKEGIGLIVSPFANSNLDVPAMPKETYALIAERGECGVLDIGGDDRGALALGRYVPEIRAEGDYEMLFVINRARAADKDGSGYDPCAAGNRGRLWAAVHGSRQQYESRAGDGGGGCAVKHALCGSGRRAGRAAAQDDLLRCMALRRAAREHSKPVPDGDPEAILPITINGGTRWQN